jgi:hypothetical protein
MSPSSDLLSYAAFEQFGFLCVTSPSSDLLSYAAFEQFGFLFHLRAHSNDDVQMWSVVFRGSILGSYGVVPWFSPEGFEPLAFLGCVSYS